MSNEDDENRSGDLTDDDSKKGKSKKIPEKDVLFDTLKKARDFLKSSNTLKIPLRAVGMTQADPRYTEFYNKTQRLIRENYIKLLEKRQGISASFQEKINLIDRQFEEGLLTLSQYYLILDAVVNEAKLAERQLLKFTDQANKKINAISQQSLDFSAEIAKYDDEKLLRTIICGLLIVAPILPIPILDGVFNSISFFFDPNQTIGETFASSVTSENLGFLGDFFDMIQLDEFLRLLFDETPILSDIFKTVEAIGESTPVYTVASTLKSPALLAGPMIMAVGAGTYLMDMKFQRYNLVKARKEKIDSELRDAQISLNNGLDKDIDEVTKQGNKEFVASLKKDSLITDIVKRINKLYHDQRMDGTILIRLCQNIPGLKITQEDLGYRKQKELTAKLLAMTDENLDKVFQRMTDYEAIKMKKVFDAIYELDQNCIHSDQLRDFFSFKDDAPEDADPKSIKEKKFQEFLKTFYEDQNFQGQVINLVNQNSRGRNFYPSDKEVERISNGHDYSKLSQYYKEEFRSSQNYDIAETLKEMIDYEITQCHQLSDEMSNQERRNLPNDIKVHGSITTQDRINELNYQKEILDLAIHCGDQQEIDKAIGLWSERQIKDNLFRSKIDNNLVPKFSMVGNGKDPINFAQLRPSTSPMIGGTNLEDRKELGELSRKVQQLKKSFGDNKKPDGRF